jgi:hypothetical protein
MNIAFANEKKLEKTEVVEIKVYQQDTKRCHPNCPYCYKDDGLYRCARYYEFVDGTGFDDTDDMYGFKRTDKCLADFGE